MEMEMESTLKKSRSVCEREQDRNMKAGLIVSVTKKQQASELRGSRRHLPAWQRASHPFGTALAHFAPF